MISPSFPFITKIWKGTVSCRILVVGTRSEWVAAPSWWRHSRSCSLFSPSTPTTTTATTSGSLALSASLSTWLLWQHDAPTPTPHPPTLHYGWLSGLRERRSCGRGRGVGCWAPGPGRVTKYAARVWWGLPVVLVGESVGDLRLKHVHLCTLWKGLIGRSGESGGEIWMFKD